MRGVTNSNLVKVDEDTPVLPEMWLEQKLDHFDHTNLRMWRQRYFVNRTHWKSEDGPVFVLIGGEGPDNPMWLVADTEIMINARKYNALVFTLEHRFYGKSHPTEDLSVENLKYLSSQQALADLAYFHDHVSSMYKLTDKNKWIAVGGSYSGNLAAWFRIKYPHLAVGAVASSAPVRAELDFTQYLDVVSASLEYAGGAACVAAVREANKQFATFTTSAEGWKTLESLFKVSPPLTNENDLQNLAQSLAGNFMDIVQYNKDNTAFEGRVLPDTIEGLCQVMKDTKLGNELARYAAINKHLLAFNNETTLDVNYDSFIREMRNTSWDGPASDGGRQWTFQTCSQFAYFQTTDSPDQPFGTFFPLKFSVQQCMDIYGPQFNQDAILSAVEWSNTYYGGKDITSSSASNIVFPNGSIDPWHALGITTSFSSKSLEAIFITGTAHCANMYPPRDSDVAELKEARVKISNMIGKWLQESR